MNRLEKAAAFGAMMGKRAANEDHDFKAGPPKNVYGGPHNRVGTLPSASTTPRVPDLSVKSPDGKWSLKSEEPYNAFISTNYSPPEGGLGTSRLKFHKSLTGQLNELNPKTSPTMPSRASLLGQDGAWNKWDARMGQIASDMSDNAPVPHMAWSKHPFEALGQTPHAADWSYTGSPRVQYSLVPRLHPEQGKPRYAGGAQKTTDEPRSLDNINATRVHENTHAGWQDLEMAGRKHYAHTTDYKGLPINNRSTINDAFGDYYAKKAPGAEYGNNFNSYSKGPRALRWYNTGNKYNKLLDNTYADPFSPSQLSDSLAAKGRTAAVEAGAVFNELGQSSRAFKDVTGKHMVGDYNFSPEVSMSNRELGELAKKYKPSDLNSPAGQLWLRRILETSK